MRKLHNSSHKIDLIFVLALFTIFAATAFLAVLIGARQYQITADNMNYNYEVRTTSSYLSEKIRQNDSYDSFCITRLTEEDGLISVDPNGDISALAIYSTEGDRRYVTYIYCYDGFLRELFISENASLALSSGQKLIAIHDLDITLCSEELIYMQFTGTDGISYPLYLSIHTGSGKEAL